MEIGQIFFVLMVMGIVVSWTFAGIKGYQRGKTKGVTQFLLHLVGAVATVFVLWLLIVAPSLDCTGFLCGLEYILLWLIISMIMMLIWPLVLLALFKKKWPQEIKPIRRNEDILDDLE